MKGAEIDVHSDMQDFCWMEEEEEDDALWSLLVSSLDLYMCYRTTGGTS